MKGITSALDFKTVQKVKLKNEPLDQKRSKRQETWDSKKVYLTAKTNFLNSKFLGKNNYRIFNIEEKE